LLVGGFSIFTYTFLLIYQPFGAAEIQEGRAFFLLGFALNVLIALSFNYFLLPKMLPKWLNPETWQIKKEIIYEIWSFCLIAILNFSYNSTIGKDIAPQHSLLGFVGISISIGIFPVLGLLFLTEKYLNQQNREKAQQLNQQTPLASKRNTDELIRIQADTLKSPLFEVNLQDFLFAVSDNNYTTIHFLNDDLFQTQLLRVSLKKVETQLEPFPEIIRCHRSYIINKTKIQKVSGNARSLNVQLENYTSLIPVSRSFSKEQLL